MFFVLIECACYSKNNLQTRVYCEALINTNYKEVLIPLAHVGRTPLRSNAHPPAILKTFKIKLQ